MMKWTTSSKTIKIIRSVFARNGICSQIISDNGSQLQSTLVISNSKGLTEILRDIRTSTYQGWESEENNKLNNHI